MGDDMYRADLTASDVENIIRRVRGVLAVRVITAGEEISEIHILAERERNPKRIVRDVESALQVQAGQAVDHRKISVVQMEKGQSLVALVPEPALEALATSLAAGQVCVTVETRISDVTYRGEATGPATGSNLLRLTAQAAIRAVEQYLQERCFLIEDVLEVGVAHRQAVLVAVDLVAVGGEERLLGAAYIERDKQEAVVTAVWRAISRALALWGEPSPSP